MIGVIRFIRIRINRLGNPRVVKLLPTRAIVAVLFGIENQLAGLAGTADTLFGVSLGVRRFALRCASQVIR
jgi:hypothetical protein